MDKSDSDNVSGLQRKRKISPNSKANLKPFKKGVSGNPDGKPKGALSITPILRQTITEDDIRVIVGNLIATARRKPQKQTIHTKFGSYETIDATEAKLYDSAVQTILERLDGKVTQPIGGDPARPLLFTSTLPGLGNADK